MRHIIIIRPVLGLNYGQTGTLLNLTTKDAWVEIDGEGKYLLSPDSLQITEDAYRYNTKPHVARTYEST